MTSVSHASVASHAPRRKPHRHRCAQQFESRLKTMRSQSQVYSSQRALVGGSRGSVLSLTANKGRFQESRNTKCALYPPQARNRTHWASHRNQHPLIAQTRNSAQRATEHTAGAPFSCDLLIHAGRSVTATEVRSKANVTAAVNNACKSADSPQILAAIAHEVLPSEERKKPTRTTFILTRPKGLPALSITGKKTVPLSTRNWFSTTSTTTIPTSTLM